MDRELRYQVLRAAVRDAAFLKKAHRDISPETFPEREEAVIIEAATAFYEKHHEPIGIMLRSYTDELATVQRFGAESKNRLKTLVAKALDPDGTLVSVDALVERIRALKRSAFYDEAIEEVITAHEQEKLNPALLADIVERAKLELSEDVITSISYFGKGKVDDRILRRSTFDNARYPLTLIDPLDIKTSRVAGFGHLALFVAPPNSGKGMGLVWIAQAYAAQGLKGLYFTLEDPVQEVEDRLDACLTQIPINKLKSLPNRFRKRWRKVRKRIHGRLEIIDGTEGGVTVSMIEKVVEEKRRSGFDVDFVIVDYDDELVCEKKFGGESGRRMEFAEIYRRMRQAARKLDVIWWTAAQTSKKGEGAKVVNMRMMAEDYSKARKAFIAIGIGVVDSKDPKKEHHKYLYVMRHKVDRSRFGFEMISDFPSGIFYHRERTFAMQAEKRRKASKATE